MAHNKPIQSTLSKTDTVGTGSNCPSERGVRLIESRGNLTPVIQKAHTINIGLGRVVYYKLQTETKPIQHKKAKQKMIVEDAIVG